MLHSEEFCNTYLRSSPEKGGVMTLEGFLYFYGSFFFLANKLIAFVIKEEHYAFSNSHSTKLGVCQAYALFVGVFKLSAFWKLASALLTIELGFAAVAHLSSKKLEEYGLRPMDDFLNTAMLYAVQMIIPIAFCKYTSGTEPLSVLIKMIPYRLFFGLLMTTLIFYAPNIIIQNKNNHRTLPLDYFLLIETNKLILEGMAFLFKILLLSFFFRISDRRIGATYMTLLFKLTMYGGDFAKSMSLGMSDWLSYKRCSTDTNNDCSTIGLVEDCNSIRGSCSTIVDGYYCTVILSTVLGTIWYIYYRRVLINLQYKDFNQWWPKSSRNAPQNGHQMQSILPSKSIHSNTC
ncbi:acetyl-coenzyme A transporter 1-like isoform X2 [Adelges cooleyi]|nr:acetyl-coenzyme A transporter 1-like isoform X2 [Adelges cooleyi]